MFGNLVRGAVAGAAGTSALNAATYADMALRGRPASSTPEQAVAVLAEQHGHPVPGDGEVKQNRLQGLGALNGIAVGVGIGAVAGVLRPLLSRLPTPLGATLVGAAAMAAADVPLQRLRLTDVSAWSAADWASDVVPHLAYGVVVQSVLKRAL
jgi:hypothetical protein